MKTARRREAQVQIDGNEQELSGKPAVNSQQKLSDTIQVSNNVFSVVTTRRFVFCRKPHSAVIPFRLNGKFTLERGFMVVYTTEKPEVMQEWHYLLCEKVRSGMYEVMLEEARTGLFPLEEDEMHLAPYIKGFRCK